MPLIPILAGEDALAAVINAALDNVGRTVYQTTDQTRNNNTTYLDSTSLVMAVAANAAYTIDSFIIYDTNSTADFKVRFTLPAGSSLRMGKWGLDTGAASATGSINVQVIDDTADAIEFTLGGIAAGTMLSATPRGQIATAGTAGNLQIAFAQNTANVSDSKLRIGSWVSLARIL